MYFAKVAEFAIVPEVVDVFRANQELSAAGFKSLLRPVQGEMLLVTGMIADGFLIIDAEDAVYDDELKYKWNIGNKFTTKRKNVNSRFCLNIFEK